MKSKKKSFLKITALTLVLIYILLGLCFSDDWYCYNVYKTLQTKDIKYLDRISTSNTVIRWIQNGNCYERPYKDVRNNLVNLLNNERFYYSEYIDKDCDFNLTERSVFIFIVIGQYYSYEHIDSYCDEVAMQIFPNINFFTAKKIQSPDNLFGYMFFNKSIKELKEENTNLKTEEESYTGDGGVYEVQ